MVKVLHPDRLVDVPLLMKLRKQYAHLSDLVDQVDDVFSPAVFFWYSSFLLSVCIDITFDVTLYNTVDNYPLTISILKLLVLFAAYAFIGISASLAMEESQKCIPTFYKVTSTERLWSNIQVAQALQIFGSQMESSHLALTGWKFFTLNRTYMMTVFGVLVSYVIIIVQLNPRVMTKIITG